MIDPTIEEIGRIFLYHTLSKPTFSDGFVGSADVLSKLKDNITGPLEKVGALAVFDSSDIAESLFEEMVTRDVFQIKQIPYAQKMYKFKAHSYNDLRAATLTKNEIYADAQQIPGYYRAVFEGFKRTRIGERSDPLTAVEIRDVNWGVVEKNFAGTDKKVIQTKIAELATAIQQSDLEDREKQNLIARTRAVQELLEAPDPSWREIVDLLNNRYLCAFLNTLAILQLITMA